MPSAFRCAHRVAAAAILGTLVACSTAPLPAPGERAATRPASPTAPDDGRGAAAVPTIERARSRWVGVEWNDLPGWNADRVAEFWPAFLRSCDRPAAGWASACAGARTAFASGAPAEALLRIWIEERLRPFRVESAAGDALGLATGYFEPLVEASRTRRAGFTVALYGAPADLATRRPYWTRQQIESAGDASRSLRGGEIAFLRDRLDALVLQIQGSGRLVFLSADGAPAERVRVAFAGSNEQPYRSVGRWLIEQGELRPGDASWPAIRAWARQNPRRLDEMLWSNPRYVFFREEPLPDPGVGPRGAQGVALTPGRSIAVDPLSVPYGTPVWLDTTAPLSSTALRRLVVAQDTGGAITGAVRADYFWGWGGDAEAQAGRMKQPLRMWVLWPR